MFLTGFSSHFISIFLAVVLPWLIIIFGKDTGHQIIADAKMIFHIEESKGEIEIIPQRNYSFTTFQQKSTIKQNSIFCESNKSYFLFCVFKSDHEYPANDTILKSLISRNCGNRAPPLLFTI